jgi:hypothetical protein
MSVERAGKKEAEYRSPVQLIHHDDPRAKKRLLKVVKEGTGLWVGDVRECLLHLPKEPIFDLVVDLSPENQSTQCGKISFPQALKLLSLL